MRRVLVLACGAVLGGCSLLTNFSGIDDGVRGAGDGSDAGVGSEGGPYVTQDGSSVVEGGPQVDAAPLADDCDAGACVAILAHDRTPLGIAVQGDWVYWVETGAPSLWRADRRTGVASRIDLADDAVHDPFDVAVEDDTLYWTEREPPRIASRPLAGGARVNLGSTGATALAFLAVSGGTAFATDFIASKPTSGNVYTATNAAGGLWVNQPSVVAGIAIHFDDVTWNLANSGNLAILKSPKSSTPDPVYVGYPQGSTSGLAFDGLYAFVVEDQHELVRIDITTGTRTEIFDFGEAIGNGDVAVDAQYIYVTEPARGVIARLRRQ